MWGDGHLHLMPHKRADFSSAIHDPRTIEVTDCFHEHGNLNPILFIVGIFDYAVDLAPRRSIYS
jgi:hypothetical protein